MAVDKTIEHRRRPYGDAYRTGYKDKKPEWENNAEARHRAEARHQEEARHWKEAKNRADLGRSLRHALQLSRARQVTRAKNEYVASGQGNRADISFSTISGVGGGAALGTVIGTAIIPGTGTIAGALLGGAIGAFVPNALRHGKAHHQENGKPSARV